MSGDPTSEADTSAEVDEQGDRPPDLRRATRVLLELEVGIESESNFYTGFTENMSHGGVFVATYATKPIGAKVELALTLPDDGTIRIQGVVRWLRRATEGTWSGMGVQFEELTEGQEERIKRFLALRDPLFYDDDE